MGDSTFKAHHPCSRCLCSRPRDAFAAACHIDATTTSPPPFGISTTYDTSNSLLGGLSRYRNFLLVNPATSLTPSCAAQVCQCLSFSFSITSHPSCSSSCKPFLSFSCLCLSHSISALQLQVLLPLLPSAISAIASKQASVLNWYTLVIYFTQCTYLSSGTRKRYRSSDKADTCGHPTLWFHVIDGYF